MSLLLFTILSCSSDQGIGRIPSPPDVEIVSPDDGTRMRQDDAPWVIVGQVGDASDSVDELTLSWTIGGVPASAVADIDGVVVTELDPSLLEQGQLLVELSAIDTDDQQTTASLTLFVDGPVGAPSVTITAPEDGSVFEPGDTVSFLGEATDTWTSAEDLAFEWSSSLDGDLSGSISADGQSALITTALSDGEHIVTLQVTDLDGDMGSDAISVLIAADTGGETTKEEGEDAEPGDLVLSELMVNPSVVDDTMGEWFELYNTSDVAIQIRGYTLRDDDYDTWVIDDSIVIPPGDFFLMCAQIDESVNGGVSGCDAEFLRPTLPPPGMALGNNGDEVILERPDGVEIDRLVYTDAWVETAKAVGVDPAYLTAEGNDSISNWCVQTTVMTTGGEPGTPGVENDPCG